MADFTPKKVKGDAGAAKGSLAHDNTEHQNPPHIFLEHHHLEKLGLDKMPAVGSKIKISGLAHVGATSESTSHEPSGGKAPGGEGNTKRSMTLHLHKMELGHEGITDGEKSASQHEGMKGAIDKALGTGRSEGSESSKAKGAGGKEGSKSSGG